MTARAKRPPSQRQLRVGEEIRHVIARILARGDLRDPILAAANFTVTEVRVSPDIKNATAFVVPLGGGEMAGAVSALNGAASFLRGVRKEISSTVAVWTGAHNYTIDQVLQDMIDRCRELKLRLAAPPRSAKTQATILLTVQTMNCLLARRREIPV